MYGKTLIALACALISAPAFAQAQLPPCPNQLTYHQAPCSNLQWNPSPPPKIPTTITKIPTTTGDPRTRNGSTTSAERYGLSKPNPQGPRSKLDTIGDRIKNDHPTYTNGIPGWQKGPGASEPQSHR